MFVSLTKAQFEELKKKAGGAKLTIKEDDDTHGTIDTEDVSVDYYFNECEGRLYFTVAKRHSLAAYVASDNIISTWIMDMLSAIPTPTGKSSNSGGNPSTNESVEQEEKKAS